MTWYKTAIFYECYLDAFCDGNGDGRGDLKGFLSKIDYLQDLGIDCVWMCPYYLSPRVDGGYDVADYYRIHPDYGTADDLRACVEALHARNIRLIADLVVNHTSDQHPWFIESRSSRDNPKRDWYVWSDTDQRYADARIIFVDTEPSNWTYDKQTGQYYWHRFYSQQPDLNYDNPAVQAEILKIIDFWLGLGLDGFRVDAVPYLFEREGTNCENLPETHAFLKKMRTHVDRQWPNKLLLCEANQPPVQVRDYFGDDDEFHMGFHFPLMPCLYSALKRQDRAMIVDVLEQTPPIPPLAQWGTFLRNHDELTLEMVTPEEREFMWEAYAPEPRMRLNRGIRRRLAPLLDNDRRRIELLNALLFSLPGSPILYYGDEIGMGDNIWLPDRDGLRTPMQWNDGPNAGFSPASKLYNPVISDEVYGFKEVNVVRQQADPSSLWCTMRNLIAVRKAHPALSLGTFAFDLSTPSAVLAYWRALKDERILVIANLSASEQTATFDSVNFAGCSPHDLITDRPFPLLAATTCTVTLPPYGCYWLRI